MLWIAGIILFILILVYIKIRETRSTTTSTTREYKNLSKCKEYTIVVYAETAVVYWIDCPSNCNFTSHIPKGYQIVLCSSTEPSGSGFDILSSEECKIYDNR